MSLEEFVLKYDLKFDVITFFEVLEHQDEPTHFITDVKRLLRPNGYIAFSVPNRNAFLNPLKEADMPPNHFTWWSEKSLRFFLAKNGFDVIKLYSRKFDSDGLADYIELKIRFGIGRYVFKMCMNVGGSQIGRHFVSVGDFIIRRFVSPLQIFFNLFNLPGSNFYILARLK